MLLKTKDVSEILNLSDQQIRRYIRNGLLKAKMDSVNIGYFVDIVDLYDFACNYRPIYKERIEKLFMDKNTKCEELLVIKRELNDTIERLNKIVLKLNKLEGRYGSD